MLRQNIPFKHGMNAVDMMKIDQLFAACSSGKIFFSFPAPYHMRILVIHSFGYDPRASLFPFFFFFLSNLNFELGFVGNEG